MSLMSMASLASSRRGSGQGNYWRYDAGDGQALVIRSEPAVDGERTHDVLQPGTIFDVLEEKLGEDGVLYLRLADGRGWVFDRKAGIGTLCERHVEREPTFWRYDAGDGKPLILRKGPNVSSDRTERTLRPGEVFAVSREEEGVDGVTYLRLADGRGWAFDRKPGTGPMCERQTPVEADVTPSPYWYYLGRDGKPIHLRAEPSLTAPHVEESLAPGERFFVSEERRGSEGVLYLKMGDDAGWMFDTKPGLGAVCKRHEAPVTLHIYDVPSDPTALKINGVLRALGTGAFHAGVEVYGVEWSFGANQEGDDGTGVFTVAPKSCECHTYRESLHMGHTPMTEDEARLVIGRLSKEWLAKDYDILRKNCCHFSDELCQKLQVGRIPRWVRNLSTVGRKLDDHRAGFSEALAPVVANTKEVVASVVSRGKAARGTDQSEGWRHGDFTAGLMAVVAEAAGQVASTIDDKVGPMFPSVDCSGSTDDCRKSRAMGPQGKFVKALDCQMSP